MFAQLTRRFRAFARDESGSASIEAVLWIPLFFMVLVLSVQVTLITTAQTKVMRIVQDANRGYALGRLDGTMVCNPGQTADATATQAYIVSAISGISPRATSTAKVNCATRTITSTVDMPATDLSPFRMLPNTSWLRVTVSAQQIREF
ncbi:TadE/TadG family type IV pilus assembly protein [Rubellimicrobium roseum]|uniref:TadE-like domain-containing protein n=1 Tax=Rubellimicrobium roseum TaxID=687525 RepID=A0A5C4NEA5_9RHOB|nr:TadE/TadG family type IV pilus assembly protein [Rubellimicrobium roseum]TNC72973.1 hypothetical protein FHG71_06640 [Rubellimicrobium roseum]